MHPDEIPKQGDLVRIHYMGKLSDGTCFDNSRTRGQPFEFVLGEGDVIDGWEALIPTMALEEKAELVCPPEYAYGEEGVEGIIPANETLTFRVELLDIGRPAEEGDQEENIVDVGDTEEKDEEEVNFWDKDEERESGRGPAFVWEASGSGREILIRVPLDDDVRVKQIKFNVTSTSLMCKIADKMILDGTLFAQVLTDDCFWDFEKKDGKAYLLITLGKMDSSIRWSSVLKDGDMPSDEGGVEVLGGQEAAQAVAGAKKAA
ncbi:Fkbp12 [Symbiodinium pilosum]|uniref:peptidylprolyl isomerase n=1 Tax=Symbiodinium pilosum TaxID=2952 RepID=A0A812UYB4_SYMPI|nr:Fkbp12 [Symbiodinium pilosum]